MKKKNVDVTKTKFSVLMSVYYKENPSFLDLSLESILINQTVIPKQVVLVKDGPLTNELELILNKYCEMFPRIMKIISLKENVGLGNALQIGLEHCKYDLVMRMDTDDIAVNNRFELQLKYMLSHKKVSAVGGYIGEFENDLNEELRIKTMPCSYKSVLKYAEFRNPINHMTVCFRKKDILEVGNYKPLYYLEDHYLWARLIVAGKKIENIPEILVYARIGNGFNDRRGNKKYIAGWKYLQKYMYENKFINLVKKNRNMLGMYAMVYVPSGVRGFLYDNVLRQRKRKKRKVVS